MLVPSEEVVAGRPVKFVNSVSLATDGAIYYTSMSSRWNVADGLLTATAMAPTGRVLRYDPKRKASEVLVDGLSFANGIVLSHKEDFLLYSELGTGKQYFCRYAKRKMLSDISSSHECKVELSTLYSL